MHAPAQVQALDPVLVSAAEPVRKRRPKTKGANAEIVARASLEDIVNSGKTQVTLPSGKTVNVTLPKGVVEGEKIRLKGQGTPGKTAVLQATPWSRSASSLTSFSK